MNTIYKFQLTINGNTTRCYPIYKDSVSKEYAKESGQEFFRAKLTGNLVFEGPDYVAINAAAFDTKFGLEVLISNDAGTTWTSYWRGFFFKTDCEFDVDAETISVKPNVEDEYTAILDGLEHEFNLIDLAPEIREVDADKRPLIQIYTPGESVIGCFLGGMWWEQECTPESDKNFLIQTGDGKPNFATIFTKYIIQIDNAPSDCPKVFMTPNPIYNYTTVSVTIVKDGYTLVTGHRSASYLPWGPTTLTRNSDGAQWYGGEPLSYNLPVSLNLTPVSGTPASGIISILAYELDVLSRILCDVNDIEDNPTYQIGTNDIVPDNRNYRRVKGFIIDNAIFTSESFSNTPTKWGLYEGKYYQPPYLYGAEFYPIARSSWNDFSLWFTYETWSVLEQNFEAAARMPFTIRHAYPLASVLSVLLGKVAPGITFDETAQCSEFFYAQNPIVPYNFQLLVTPKSNIINSGYDTPAQKAPITLKDVFNMLRDCFRVYWFVEGSKLRLEHISYFMNGGSYDAYPQIGVYLTDYLQPRNGKSWGNGQNKFTYEKMDAAGRYQFGWMDDVTEFFNGFPIDINSGYVSKEQVEEITVTNFTSDIDYILLCPNEVSEDGFVLLAPTLQNGRLKLPYFDYAPDGNSHILQNAYVAFCLLINFYLYDMPAFDCTMNGEPLAVVGTKRLKTNQVKFPYPTDPNLKKLIQTTIGSGQIKKLSINLCSRNVTATLMYDTE